MRHSTGSGTRRQQTGVWASSSSGRGEGEHGGGQSGPDTAEVTTTTTTTQLSADHLGCPRPAIFSSRARVTCEDVPGVTGLRDTVTVTVAAQYNCAVRHHSSHGGRVSAGTSSVARVAVYAAHQCPGYWPHLHTPPSPLKNKSKFTHFDYRSKLYNVNSAEECIV